MTLSSLRTAQRLVISCALATAGFSVYAADNTAAPVAACAALGLGESLLHGIAPVAGIGTGRGVTLGLLQGCGHRIFR